jgi:hypothetical protein
VALPRLGLSPSLGVHMEHKDRQGNAAALNHPGEVSFQISGCEVVRTAVEQPCDATHGPGVTVDRLVSHALQREGLQGLGIELVETLLLVLFHGEVSHLRDERNDTHMRVCVHPSLWNCETPDRPDLQQQPMQACINLISLGA